ncbi:MAG: hypothetical protein CFE44_00885 [Burkholderiales bacterium PBB4]|nr:MAG: hypothetical protein CFE44_00885 [Burkholderiales bacterium PBB4]
MHLRQALLEGCAMAIISGKFGGSENITGTLGDDTIFPYTGFDLIDGGAGLDTVSAAFSRANVAFTKRNGLTTMDLVSGASTANTQWRLKNVERVSFDDGGVALDLLATQAAGKAALLIGAAAGAATLKDQLITGAVIRYFDSGATLLDGANALVGSGIIAGFAGGSDNTAFVNLLYRNLFDTAPSAETTAQLTALLDSNAYTQASLLASAAALQLNQDHIHLVGLQTTGLYFF